MATRMLTFTSYLLFLQGVYSLYPSHPVPSQSSGEEITNNILNARYPISQVEETNPENYDLDDVYENQIPPPPTNEDIMSFNDGNRGELEGSFSDGGNSLAEPGPLGTNDVINSFFNTLNINGDDDSSGQPYLKLRYYINSLKKATGEQRENDEDLKNMLGQATRIQEQQNDTEDNIENITDVNGENHICENSDEEMLDQQEEQVNKDLEESKGYKYQSDQDETSDKYQVEGENQQRVNGIPKFKLLVMLKPSRSEEQTNIQEHPSLTISSPGKEKNILSVVRDNNMSSFKRFESNESENSRMQESKRFISSLGSTLNNDNKEFNIPLGFEFQRPVPNSFVLLKHLTAILREKSTVDALEKGPVKQISPSTSFLDQLKIPSQPNSKLIFVKMSNIQPQSQVFPIYFPDDNSVFKIKHVANTQAMNEDDSISEENSMPSIQGFFDNYDDTGNNDNYERQSLNTHQEVPMFINKFITNLIRPTAEKVRNQPIPIQSTPSHKPAEEKTYVHFRPFLIPLAM